MPLDAPTLSRLPLGLLVAVMVASASFALGLTGYVAVLEGLWRATRTEAFLRLRRFWAGALLIALAFAALAMAAGAATGALGPAAAAAMDRFPYRPAQLTVSALLATALAVGAVSAARLRREPDEIDSCLALKMAIGMFAICAPLEIAVSDGLRPELILGVAAAAAVLGVWGGLLCWRGAPERSRLFLAACMLMGPVALITPLAEWS